MTAVEDAAARALARLDELAAGKRPSPKAEGQLIYDPELRATLTPLMPMSALGFYCARCQKRIGWWTLHGQLAMVVFSDRRAATKKRSAGTADLDPARENPGLEPWIDRATQPGGRAEITEWSDPDRSDNNASGYPLRATFTCRCGAAYPTRNSTRLRAFLTARRTDSSRILL